MAYDPEENAPMTTVEREIYFLTIKSSIFRQPPFFFGFDLSARPSFARHSQTDGRDHTRDHHRKQEPEVVKLAPNSF